MWWYGYVNSMRDWGSAGWWWGLLVLLLILDVVLKGLALWRSARKGQKWWFVALLIVNSVGILPGIYLLTHRASRAKKK